MRIKFKSGNELLLGKILIIHARVINATCVFEVDSKFYPQVYLKHCCLEYDHTYDSYVCCKTPLKSMNNSVYWKVSV